MADQAMLMNYRPKPLQILYKCNVLSGSVYGYFSLKFLVSATSIEDGGSTFSAF